MGMGRSDGLPFGVQTSVGAVLRAGGAARVRVRCNSLKSDDLDSNLIMWAIVRRILDPEPTVPPRVDTAHCLPLSISPIGNVVGQGVRPITKIMGQRLSFLLAAGESPDALRPLPCGS